MIASLAHLAPLVLSLTPLAPPAGENEMDWTGVLDEESFAALHELSAEEAPELLGEDIEIGGAAAYLSTPPMGESLGAIVVVHEWWGLNDHVKHWADRLASDGYTALAVDLYGGTVATTREGAMSAMRGVDEDEARTKLLAAHAFLVDEEGPVAAERTASIGWCFGGGWSLRLAIAEAELDASVVYYGRLIDDVETLSSISGPMLGVFGDQDTGIPPTAVKAFADAMEEAGNDLELAQYDAAHAFANPSSARYDAEHAGAAWRRTREFLCRSLWPVQAEGSLGRRTRALEMWTPEGWSAETSEGMRLATVKIRSGLECTLISLGGAGGGLVPNINRWRGQMGLGEMSDEDAEDLPLVPMLGTMATLVRLEGDSKPMRGEQITGAVMLAAICQLESETLFVKLVGPRDEVDAQAEAFTAFCRGLR